MKLLNYTRLPMEDAVYARRLAYSMHLALENENGSWTALNHNSGVLFVKATENENGSLNPKSLKNPWLFSLREGGYGVFAVRTLADGGDDTEDLGTAVFWTTQDLLRYEERGLVKLSDAPVREVRCDQAGNGYVLQWKLGNGEWKERKLESLDELRLNDQAVKLAGAPLAEEAVLAAEGEARRTGAEATALTGADEKGGLPVPGEIQGCVARNVIEIPDALGEYLKKKLMPAENIGVEAPEEIRVSLGKGSRTGAEGLEGSDALAGAEGPDALAGAEDPEVQEAWEQLKKELLDVRVKALYSDGTKVPKKVLWNAADIAKIDVSRPGRYALRGKLTQPHFEFPICTDRADPCVCRWNGKYYYIATNDADFNHTLYMRCADTLEGIRDAEEHLILDSTTYEGIGGLLWAPEFHVIDGRMYLFHACTPGPFFCEESHVMELREGGDPLKKEDWSRPKRVVNADGSDICEMGKEITLDMTEFEWQGELYAIWSQRQFLPKDLGAWLYIAKLDRKEPWKLASKSVVLSKPEYGWANNHTFVDEGPFALIRGDKLYVTFSSAAVDSTYVVGLLQIEKGKDLLDPGNWRKNNYPLFTSRSYAGEYGTGHNAYVTDEDGITWNTYHARPGVDGPRSTGIRRVHFDVDGEPMLDVTEELDLREGCRDFETVLVMG